MPLTYSLPPDNILPALIGEFVEIRREIGTENQGLIGAIRAGTRERINQAFCDISTKKKEEKVKEIIHQAIVLEQEIVHAIQQKIANDTHRSGFMSWSVGDGKNKENIFFQKILSLYQLRYGENEAQEIVDIFSNPENNNKYKLYIEYGEAPNGSGLFIRKLWLRNIESEK